MSNYVELLKRAEKAASHEEAELILEELKRLQQNRRKQQEAA